MTNSPLHTRIKNTIDTYHLLSKGDSVLIAVSGGVDSVVLTHVLWRLRESWRLTLHLIHIHHGLRGEEADRDEQFVQEFGASLNIPVLPQRVDVNGYVQEHRTSVEDAARTLRYQCFQEVLESQPADVVALGHHADDQAETILDHFIRGSGPAGLSGMRRKNGPFIRPLLDVTRQEIETYAHSEGLKYIIDSTNADIRFKRNKIRHRLIPFLKDEFNPSIVDGLLRTGTVFSQVHDYFVSEAAHAVEYCTIQAQKDKIILDIHRFFQYFNIIQIYVLYHIVDVLAGQKVQLPVTTQFRFLEFLKENRIGSKLELPDNWEILIDHDGLVFHRPVNRNETVSVTPDRWVVFGCQRFLVSEHQRAGIDIRFGADRFMEYIDREQVSMPLTLRTFQPGDRFVPFNNSGGKKISDFFTDLKVPLHERPYVPILFDQAGIVWVAGYRIADRVKITEQTTHILKLEMRKDLHD
ncbi:tRNA lysidine(34) synthetase TilS [candidate division KSB1 bacterium]|nr:tRNA lysidine(34) synthetase TilS [candidate division KSB1 bacterium]